MYKRKEYDKRKLRKLACTVGERSVCGAYYDDRKDRYVRFWKSDGKNSSWAYLKRLSRRRARKRTAKNGFYSKKLDDLWWNMW